MQVEEGGGSPHSPPRVKYTFPAAAPQSLGLDPTYLAAVQDGLWQATHSGVGTSTSVFGTFPIPIAGKTGTAQKDPSTDQKDQSWWCGYGPAESTTPPELVVCALIENGGFGADAAAPAALQVFKEYFKKQLDSGQVAR
jgi:penicillin-binding protein 2